MTEEQQHIIDTVLSDKSNNKIIAVNACAGSGKTYTSLNILKHLNPDTAFYTAFNKAIVEETKEKINNMFPFQNKEAGTIHSLAYKFNKHKKVKTISYMDFPKSMRYKDKRDAMELFRNYCLSKYQYFEDYIYSLNTYIDDIIVNSVNELIWKIENDKINTSFDYMLKQFHIKLLKGQIKFNIDCFIFDEVQDVTEVSLEIFKLINAKKKIMLGDTYQNIYGFMNTVNGFKLLDDTIKCNLTKSFRCNPYIADKVQKFVRKHINEHYVFTGTEQENTLEKTAYLFRNNSSLVNGLINRIDKNEDFNTIRNPEELLETVMAIADITHNYNVTSAKYSYLKSIANLYFKNASSIEQKLHILLEKTDYDEEIEAGVKLYKKLRDKHLHTNFIIEEVHKKNAIKNNNIYSSVHTYKGLEADVVVIDESLNNSIEKAIKNKSLFMEEHKGEKLPSDIEEPFNIYYTALTRAKNEIKGALY